MIETNNTVNNRDNEQRERTNDEHQKTRQQERERVPSRQHSSLER